MSDRQKRTINILNEPCQVALNRPEPEMSCPTEDAPEALGRGPVSERMSLAALLYHVLYR